MGLFSGMENFGIKKIDAKELYARDEKPAAKKEEEAPKVPEEPEENFIFAKKYTCPVCSSNITSLTVKSAKLRMTGMDIDLRPRYQQMDPVKYDVVLCPKCGYANMARNFEMIMPAHKKLIMDNICAGFHYDDPKSTKYSYDEALTRYKIALSNAMAKKAKDSEKAYICLKMGWILRGKREKLDTSAPDYKELLEECRVDEKGALQLAKDGFISARASEDFPMAGMDETTLDYLVSALSVELGDPNTAAKLLSNIITSKTANNRIKDKARALMDKAKKMIEAAKEAEE